MGNRSNIVVKNSGQPAPIFLYSHWDGEDLVDTLCEALKRVPRRWSDAPYLTRAIFCQMVKDDVMGETGYGISSCECDNEHLLIIVDTDAQEIEIAGTRQSFLAFVNDPAQMKRMMEER